MLFPQFAIYQQRNRFNYVDISNILVLMLNLRQTWNAANLRTDTHNTWMHFKDKLSEDQKIVMRKAITGIRASFNTKANSMNTVWLTSNIMVNLYNINTKPYVTSFHKRQEVIKSFQLNNLALNFA